jgi:hypothetical protein
MKEALVGNPWNLLEEKNELGRDFPFVNRQIGIYRLVASLFLIGRLAYQPKSEENQTFIAQRMPFVDEGGYCFWMRPNAGCGGVGLRPDMKVRATCCRRLGGHVM